MWKLGEPGARFPAAAPNHPEALLEEPQAFQAVGGKKWKKSKAIHRRVLSCLPPTSQSLNFQDLKLALSSGKNSHKHLYACAFLGRDGNQQKMSLSD